MADKLSHAAVQYGPGHPDGDHCAICEHYQGEHRCKLVESPIYPTGWCIKFAKKKGKKRERQA